jgi:hypothetical protein
MTREVVYELTNNDREHYNEVSAKIDIPWNCRRVEYWVDSVNTFSNFFVTTKEDFVEVEYGDSDGGKFIPEFDEVSVENYITPIIKITEANREVWKAFCPEWADPDANNYCIWEIFDANGWLEWYGGGDRTYPKASFTSNRFEIAGINHYFNVYLSDFDIDPSWKILQLKIHGLESQTAFTWSISEPDPDIPPTETLLDTIFDLTISGTVVKKRFQLQDITEGNVKNLTELLRHMLKSQELDATNVFFASISGDELMSLETVEVIPSRGNEDEDDILKSLVGEEKDALPVGILSTLSQRRSIDDEDEDVNVDDDNDVFIYDANGDITGVKEREN